MPQTKEARADIFCNTISSESDRRLQKLNVPHLLCGLFFGAAASGIFFFLPYITTQSAVTLVIFNLLFALLIFPLEGGLHKKVAMLLTGNALGFVWNVLFARLAQLMSATFGDAFNYVYLLVGPLLNVLWIVSYWSIGLTVLSGQPHSED